MSKVIRNGLMMACLAAVAVGCGNQDDKLVKEQIALLDAWASTLDQVTDKASAEKVFGEKRAAHDEKMKQNFAKLEALSEERRNAAMARHKDELAEASMRVRQKSAMAIKHLAPPR